MANRRTATTTAEARRLQIQMKKQADNLTDTILHYLRLLGATGITTPPPPRPKYPIVASVTYAALLLELAFRVRGGSGR